MMNVKSELELARSGSTFAIRTPTHLPSLSAYLMLYLFFSAHAITRSNAAQKFYPNGRYGRRSELPPLFGSSLISKIAPELNSNDKDSTNWAYTGTNSAEEYVPMWCAEINSKANIFKCFNRFPFQLLKQSSERKLMELGATSNNNHAPSQDMDQQS